MQPHIIAFDPDDDDHIVIGTDAAGSIESADGGASWDTIIGSNRVTAISALYFNPDRSVVVATYGRGLWKITDAGDPYRTFSAPAMVAVLFSGE